MGRSEFIEYFKQLTSLTARHRAEVQKILHRSSSRSPTAVMQALSAPGKCPCCHALPNSYTPGVQSWTAALPLPRLW